MKTTRSSRAKLNSITTLANQIITTVTGLIIPRMMLGAFGSALYGATTSIAQFLSYISLLESGVGRAARAALYKPLADRDSEKVSKVYFAIVRFFRYVAIIFCVYTILLAFSYYDIANVREISREYVIFLVIAISLSTLIEYLCGISNMTLINADQRKYITNSAIIVTRILNTVLILVLINLGSGIITVKLGSSLIIILRPLFLSWYVKKHYTLRKTSRVKTGRRDDALPQKWTGMSQHIAYFVHSNTDVVLLTVFSDLRLVAVYAIYSLVTISIRNIVFSLAGGLEAELGDMYAKGEQETLTRKYKQYQFIMSFSSVLLFGVTALMILPFVLLYTSGITDVNYFQPAFALLLILGEVLNCLALPCSTLPVSCNQLKKTRWGAYGEAVINIVFSCALIWWNPLLSVAIGTLTAEVFKLFYYSVYASKRIIKNSVFRQLLRHTLVFAAVLLFGFSGIFLFPLLRVQNYFIWILYAIPATVIALGISLAIMRICYGDELKITLKRTIALFRRA
ncbi:MAG: hypothetical protein IKS19_06630 [Clostridia bacterium]|nr:hypothetical protein [Clostridia bacterium]